MFRKIRRRGFARNFGPIVTIIPFDTEEEALRIANDTEYGLNGVVWTENLQRAHRISHAVRAGTIWVNCWFVRDLRAPFGGFKKSGIGREGGAHPQHGILYRGKKYLHCFKVGLNKTT